MSETRVGILGMGRLGTHLKESLTANHCHVDVYERSQDSAEALTQWADRNKVLCLTCRDDQLEGLAGRLAQLRFKKTVILMFSGAKSLELLTALTERGAVIGKLHPLMAFTQVESKPIPAGTPFAMEGEIEELVRPWVTAWGGKLYRLEGQQWAMYHLAAVMAANFLPLFIRAGAQILEPLAGGQQQALDWLEPLVQVSVAEALDGRNQQPYAGPAIRGDETVLAQHEALLTDHYPQLRDLYRQASSQITALKERSVSSHSSRFSTAE